MLSAVSFWRRRPGANVRRMAVTVDHISNGRVEVGLERWLLRWDPYPTRRFGLDVVVVDADVGSFPPLAEPRPMAAGALLVVR